MRPPTLDGRASAPAWVVADRASSTGARRNAVLKIPASVQ